LLDVDAPSIRAHPLGDRERVGRVEPVILQERRETRLAARIIAASDGPDLV
jgi:hypothetical protein